MTIKKWKTCAVFLSSYRNMSESLGEQEILVYFYHQNVHSLCSRHHYVNSLC